MKSVAIFGCGPSALLCAHACEAAGHNVHIFSRKEKSVIPGSQHLHGPVPGVTSQYPEGTILFVRIGTAEGYAQKVYGDPTRETGWKNYRQVYPSWNVVNAYDKLWARYENRVVNIRDVTTAMLRAAISDYDLVISTLPAQALCRVAQGEHGHHFRNVPYYIKTLPTPPEDVQHEMVIYNGLPTDKWYRWSILGGLCSIEYARRPADAGDFIQGRKAIETDCDCWPEIQRCGRWAEWRHGVTMFSAYQKAARLAEEIK